eukprot:3074829-Pleurochrysis_carterae.AAC.1
MTSAAHGADMRGVNDGARCDGHCEPSGEQRDCSDGEQPDSSTLHHSCTTSEASAVNYALSFASCLLGAKTGQKG